MRKPHLLIAFASLLALAVFLMWLSDRPTRSAQKSKATPPSFPSRFSPKQSARIERRLTMAPAPSAQTGQRRDPLFVALPADATTAVVFEAAVIRDTEVGRLAMKCLTRASEHDEPKAIRNVLQFVNNLDRLAITNHLVAASGDFAGIDWSANDTTKQEPRSYGSQGKFHEGGDSEQSRQALATYGSAMILLGDGPKDVEQSIDQLDDRKPVSESPIDPQVGYGDIYGRVDALKVAELLPNEIGDTWRQIAKSVELHVDVQDDILIVADVTGTELERLNELGRTIAGALSVARLHAKATGNQELGQILEYARVIPNARDFRIEIALPAELVSKTLGACVSGSDAGLASP